MEPLTFLRAHPPFDRLDGAGLRAVEEALQIVYRPRGTVILKEGGPTSRFLSVIRKGVVHLERGGRLIQTLEEGECFGFPSMISHGSPVANAIAVEDALLYQLPEPVFSDLMKQPGWSEFFLLDLAERLRKSAAPEPLPLGRDLALPARQLARDVVVLVPAGADVGEAARRMRDARTSSVIVEGEAQGAPPGIVTDRDLRTKVLAEGLGPSTPVSQVASRPLRALPADASLYEALVFMLEHEVHHVPLADDGAIVGMLTDTDLLRLQGRSPLGVLAGIDGVTSLAGYGAEIRSTVESLAAGGLEAAKIGRIVARLNDSLVGRLLRSAERELGAPPSPYAWIVYGSEGRMEQALLTDQDNALVYREELPGAADYFHALAKRVVDGLVRASFPPCPGGFMATSWCRPLAGWTELFRGFIATPDAGALLEASCFFDLRKVHGGLDLEPLETLLLGARDRPVFLAHLARTALSFEPPLSLLRRIRDDEGGVDLKRGGLLPIVGLARLHALEAGSPARSTLDRLAAAASSGVLSSEGAATLSEAFRFLLGLRLRVQLEALHRGQPPDNQVHLEQLSPLERRHLKDTFLAVRDLQQATALRYSTARLG